MALRPAGKKFSENLKPEINSDRTEDADELFHDAFGFEASHLIRRHAEPIGRD